MKKCVACGKELDDVNRKCPDCKSKLRPDICNTCGKAMPRGAKRCNACSTYSGRWKHLPIISQLAQILGGAVLVGGAIVSVVFYFSDRESHTHFLLASPDSTSVVIKVWNTGKKPSQLVGYHLHFDKLPKEREALLVLSPNDVQAANNIIESAKPVVLKLKIAVWNRLPKDLADKQYGSTEIRNLHEWWSTQPMTLYVDVRESSDDSDHHQVLKDQFRSDRVRDFVATVWGLTPGVN